MSSVKAIGKEDEIEEGLGDEEVEGLGVG